MKKQVKPEFTIAVDSREQRPYKYDNAVCKYLKSGDYSIVGYEDKIAVERKTVQELFTCVGRDRKRFEREIIRLQNYDYAAIVIEGNLLDLVKPSAFSKVSPKVVFNTLISWSIKYGIHLFFAGSRKYARAVTYRILEKYYKNKEQL
nr:hypothetical protein 2 [Elusimicrobiota bacterium]